jgi:serine O-acetyltransferase
MRICAYMRQHRRFRGFIYPLARLNLHRYKVKYGIEIYETTQVGSGPFIGHFGGIFVNVDAVIGRNCNLSQGVTLGLAVRGKRKGVPTIGDNVYVGPGAKIIGNVKIGNNACIGANCVVTQDVPDHAVVAGVPGRILSYAGSEDYVARTDY